MKIERIDQPEKMKWCAEQLQQVQQLALDLEFDKNRYRYGFQLCLMQIAAQDTCYIIDPLSAGVEVNLLFPLFEDERIEKVVFAFGEDLRLLHTLGCFPRGLYDLRQSMSLLNYPPASLSTLLEEVLGVQSVKSAQNSNWFTRPLTDTQVEYAADDVRYLIALKEKIAVEAETKGITAWVDEENRFAEEQDYSNTAFNEVFRAKDKFGHSAYSWHIMEKLLNFREELAEEINRPGYQVIHKDYLLELSQNDAALKNWKQVKGIHPTIRNDKTFNRIQLLLDHAHASAKEKQLSTTDEAIPKLSYEELREKRKKSAEVERLKQEVFVPLKERMIQHYGENAVTFMLSNRALTDILYGNKEQHLRQYKKDLLLKYAAELNISVEQFL